MNDLKYKATISGEEGRSGWCIIFRHPIRKKPDGTAVRVRRGLGTKARNEAQILVDQMNEILSDVAFWTPQARSKAEAIYDRRIVDAFYDQLFPASIDPWALRSEIIPIPGPEEGYARARLLGTTGAGKTTLVRQLIGTNPTSERFPSTSTAKTTVCDIEIIMADTEFKAVVTFFPREQVLLLIEECVLAAATAFKFETGKLTSPATKLLEHNEQRFRLNYILGNFEVQNSDLTDDDDESPSIDQEGTEVSEIERKAMTSQIHRYVERIKRVATATIPRVEAELGIALAELEKKDADAFQELFEDYLRQQDEFHQIVDDIFDAVESRFENVPKEGFRFDRNGWPLLWQFETNDRPEFVRTVNRFSSNYAPNFGKLLTPLVQGIRVRGPFQPDWLSGDAPKLVLMDGEGLGHTPDSSASISTNITQRLNEIDAVVLVDSAQQPMQAGPQSLLRTLSASGHGSKLIVCFTHFDSVKGDNLKDTTAKKQHVNRSLQNAIASLREIQGRSAENALNRAISDRVFFVSNIQNPIKDSARMTLAELGSLVEAIKKSIIPPTPPKVVPVYDISKFVLSIAQAMVAFRNPWRGRLNLSSHSNISPEHWTRIKALARRFAELGSLEYDTLRPVADFILQMSEQVTIFLGSPLRWEPNNAPDEMQQQVISEIARRVSAELHNLGTKRLFHDRVKEWMVAYSHRGTGSSFDRARDIDGIYNIAAPIPGETRGGNTDILLDDLNIIIREAVNKGGGRFAS